ncbi:aromatase/cyclase [Amycolatopsis silviterrae]|uniref:Aromatase/cyclase n=1 Tax=Amycolatopsis silviterrae TaxID=1656914 RepID=A0ABW5H6I3_9PSEU
MRHHTEHHIDVRAPAEVVYRIIADAASWPQHFAPTIHVEQSQVDAKTEQLVIWATANGTVKNWTSRRELDPGAGRVRFRQTVSAPPVASMSGEWTVREHGDGARLTLEHDFSAIDDEAESAEWIRQATDRNSTAELGNIKALAESWDRLGELLFEFDDSVLVRAPLADVYDFFYRAAEWPSRLPHVSRLELREPVEHVQEMSMDTSAKDGSTHTTESIRLCRTGKDIVYKQTQPPSLMTAHLGRWSFTPESDGVRVTSWHRVTINEENIHPVLGPDATVATAREFVRNAAGGNSRDTLGLAKAFAESSAETAHA